VIEDMSNIAGMFLHGRRAFTYRTVTVTAQVGKDKLVARRQRLGGRQPELMMHRKRMKKNYGRAGSQDLVRDVRVTALDMNHRADLTLEILNRKDANDDRKEEGRKEKLWAGAGLHYAIWAG
jgi:hypothetical protein